MLPRTASLALGMPRYSFPTVRCASWFWAHSNWTVWIPCVRRKMTGRILTAECVSVAGKWRGSMEKKGGTNQEATSV